MSKVAEKNAAEANVTYGAFTEEGPERLRQRMGMQFNQPRVPHDLEVTFDGCAISRWVTATTIPSGATDTMARGALEAGPHSSRDSP